MSIRVSGVDLTIGAMNEKLRFLVSRYIASDCNCFPLSAGSNGSAGIACTLDLPPTSGVFCNVLIFTHALPPYTRGRSSKSSCLYISGVDRTYFSP